MVNLVSLFTPLNPNTLERLKQLNTPAKTYNVILKRATLLQLHPR
ncbi:hypothetical protein [Mucilaginibacter sp. BT774]|nr:hypothetical protein [Mucilaginibacter sp. BT774]MDO3628502.1 hypothetical protein [Mucilaginibacter sp. BT774]